MEGGLRTIQTSQPAMPARRDTRAPRPPDARVSLPAESVESGWHGTTAGDWRGTHSKVSIPHLPTSRSPPKRLIAGEESYAGRRTMRQRRKQTVPLHPVPPARQL